jgi:hypothetical protein
MLKSKFSMFFSMLILVLAMGSFFASTYAYFPPTCPICAGQSSPTPNMDCEEVNLGGRAWCQESWDGDCSESGMECPTQE